MDDDAIEFPGSNFDLLASLVLHVEFVRGILVEVLEVDKLPGPEAVVVDRPGEVERRHNVVDVRGNGIVLFGRPGDVIHLVEVRREVPAEPPFPNVLFKPPREHAN